MSDSFNSCNVCEKLIVSDNANYCSRQCRKIDSRLYYSKLAIFMVLFLIIAFSIYAVVLPLNLLFAGMVLSGVTIMVLIPIYQFYQGTRIDRKLKIMYTKNNIRYTEDGQRIQPVYIYLYINRHTEDMLDEDYSEYL